jgi:protein-tyrosine-phosphatase
MHTFLFVCTGNTCRSPMAEAVARQWILEGGLGAPEDGLAVSAGVAAAEGMPPTPEAVDAMAELGIRVEGRSKPLTRAMVERATAVFCLTERHARAVRAMVEDDPDLVARVHRLDPEGDIDDPIGRGPAVYRAVADRLLAVVPAALQSWSRAARA